MELKKSNSILFFLSGLVTFIITVMGIWWLYLISTFGEKLKILNGENGPNIERLIKWEGSAFILLLLVITISHGILFRKDQKKNKSIHAFFAGLTHELKTPLASIRLQAEVLQAEALKLEHDRLNKLSDRLIEDTARLEMQMDKILQLSRIERGGNLNLKSIDIRSLIDRCIKEHASGLETNVNVTENNLEVMADEFALGLILKNLIENTKNHTSSKVFDLSVQKVGDIVQVTYSDNGEFDGDIKKLGHLFYKYKSSKGSGIGLYLSKKLIKQMNGEFDITKEKGLKFVIKLVHSGGQA